MIPPISITAIGSISPLGTSLEEVWRNYVSDAHCFVTKNLNGSKEWVAPLSVAAKEEITAIRNSDAKYKSLDDTVLFALYASRKAVKQAGWKTGDDFGVNIGSSRGATALFEKYHEAYINTGKTPTLTSPTTTLGNIASWVGHDLSSQGPDISHSITCSTALHATLNGVAWLRSGMVDKFLVGGSEAPLTGFTITQMKALKIYAKNETDMLDEHSRIHPCQALNLDKKRNTMILGEGAAVACLEISRSEKTLAIIEGIGYATEVLQHNISISSDAICFQRSMKMALGGVNPSEVDVIVMHAPGTIKGDLSEYNAISTVFCNKIPFLTTNKWKVGHTFGTSGMLSIEMAVLMLQHQEVIPVPFGRKFQSPSKIQKIMVNAVGFGGNAVSVLLSI